MDIVSLLGYFAAFVGTVSFLPQTIKCWKTKHTKDISLPGYLILCLGTASWTLYGVLRGDAPVIFTNAAIFGMALAIVLMKLRYG